MKRSGHFAGLVAALALPLFVVVAADTSAQPAGDGLVKVRSRMLDSLQLRPDSGLSAYRRVIVEPAQAALAKNWLKDLNNQRSVGRRLGPEDAQRITAQAARTLTAAVAEGFRMQGYEIVSAPGEGVLRLTPTVTDLWVNAPDVPTPGIQREFVRDAGDAVLRLEVRDTASGKLLGLVVHKGTANQMHEINRSSGVSNQFWFEAMFRQWATNCAKAFAKADAPQGGLARR